MSLSQFKKYFWLVDTIRSAGKISKDEIDRKWRSTSINERHEPKIPDSSFFRFINDDHLGTTAEPFKPAFVVAK